MRFIFKHSCAVFKGLHEGSINDSFIFMWVLSIKTSWKAGCQMGTVMRNISQVFRWYFDNSLWYPNLIWYFQNWYSGLAHSAPKIQEAPTNGLRMPLIHQVPTCSSKPFTANARLNARVQFFFITIATFRIILNHFFQNSDYG